MTDQEIVRKVLSLAGKGTTRWIAEELTKASHTPRTPAEVRLIFAAYAMGNLDTARVA